jgi:hypothetical protein
VDRVIRYEALEEGFAEVCAAIGRPHTELLRINVGRRPDYRDVFDAEARRLFDARFAEDIERLGYRY